jgi:hypothetical protein
MGFELLNVIVFALLQGELRSNNNNNNATHIAFQLGN